MKCYNVLKCSAMREFQNLYIKVDLACISSRLQPPDYNNFIKSLASACKFVSSTSYYDTNQQFFGNPNNPNLLGEMKSECGICASDWPLLQGNSSRGSWIVPFWPVYHRSGGYGIDQQDHCIIYGNHTFLFSSIKILFKTILQWEYTICKGKTLPEPAAPPPLQLCYKQIIWYGPPLFRPLAKIVFFWMVCTCVALSFIHEG